MDARQLFLADHARVHAQAVSEDTDLLAGERLAQNLSDAQLREGPAGHSSIAWLLWHVARCEDVAVNTVLRGRPKVLDRDGWLATVRADGRDLGIGMTAAEVDDFSARVDLDGLRAYRSSVGRETRTWGATLNVDELDAGVDVAARLAAAPAIVRERGAWVPTFWAGRTGGWFLSWLVVGHTYFHLGEAEHVARTLGHPGG